MAAHFFEVAVSTRWSESRLDALRDEGDLPADNAVAAVLQMGGLESVNGVLRGLVENDGLVPGDLPAPLRDYLLTTGELPEWADREQIALGQDFFSRFGPEIVLVLHCRALPECYAGANGANALYLTHGMSQHVHRRIIETAQFVLDVMVPGGLEPTGHGVRTTQKVRLVHAALRHILARLPTYDRAWGVPINQEDLAGTLMAFSVLTLESLEKLGITAKPDEAEAYLHAWKVVGHVLGISPELIPSDRADAHALYQAIRKRQYRESEAGRVLTKALIDFIKYTIPGSLFDGFATVLTHYLVGDEVAQMIGAAHDDWTRALLGPMRLLFGVSDLLGEHAGPIGRLSGKFSRKMLEGLFFVERGGNRVQFRIPQSLRDEWRLGD